MTTAALGHFALLLISTALLSGQTKSPAPVWGETTSPEAASGPALENEEIGEVHRAFAVLGNSVADSLELSELKWTPEEFEAFLAGMRARYQGKVIPADEKSGAVIAAQQKQIAEVKRRRGSKDMRTAFDEVRRSLKMDALPSGLAYKVIAGGTGPRPRPQDTVILNVNGRRLQDAQEVKSLQLPGLKTKVADLIPGLAEGVQLLKIGGSTMYLIPGDMSYGAGEWPEDVPRGSPIVVAVQLVDIIPAP